MSEWRETRRQLIADLRSTVRHPNQLDDDESMDDAIARIVDHWLPSPPVTEPPTKSSGISSELVASPVTEEVREEPVAWLVEWRDREGAAWGFFGAVRTEEGATAHAKAEANRGHLTRVVPLYRRGSEVEGGESAPTPASIRAMAEWFDNPNKSPSMVVVLPLGGDRLTPGYILRRIADTLEAAPTIHEPSHD